MNKFARHEKDVHHHFVTPRVPGIPCCNTVKDFSPDFFWLSRYKPNRRISPLHTWQFCAQIFLACVLLIGTVQVWQYLQGTGLHNNDCFRTASPRKSGPCTHTSPKFIWIELDHGKPQSAKAAKPHAMQPCLVAYPGWGIEYLRNH